LPQACPWARPGAPAGHGRPARAPRWPDARRAA